MAVLAKVVGQVNGEFFQNKSQYLNVKNIICCRVSIDNIILRAQSQLNLVVEFVWISES